MILIETQENTKNHGIAEEQIIIFLISTETGLGLLR